MCIRVDANGWGSVATHMSVFVHFMRGEFDDLLVWPFRFYITIELVNHKSEHGHVVDTPTPSKRVTSDKLTDTLGRGCLQFIHILWWSPLLRPDNTSTMTV